MLKYKSSWHKMSEAFFDFFANGSTKVLRRNILVGHICPSGYRQINSIFVCGQVDIYSNSYFSLIGQISFIMAKYQLIESSKSQEKA